MAVPVPAPDDALDHGIPWHFGDPLREQRRLMAGEAVVDLSNRGIVTVSGPDRLSWLNDLTTAQLLGLTPGESRSALILDPHGRVEHELHVVDDGERTWLIVEPGAAGDIAGYLRSMQFMLRVEVADVSADFAVVGSLGPATVPGDVVTWQVPAEFAGTGTTPAGEDRGGGADKYVPHRPGVFPAVEHVVRRSELPAAVAAVPHRAGTWAWEALRVAAGVPREGADTDARSLPHELGWIGPAVHLAKGCYRGQETVARTHNMGRPPRRLVLLHLDGSAQELPVHGDPVMVGDKQVGWVGSAAQHYELGPIALAVVKHRTDPDETLHVGVVSAAQELIVV